jgi:hypothetical protein
MLEQDGPHRRSHETSNVRTTTVSHRFRSPPDPGGRSRNRPAIHAIAAVLGGGGRIKAKGWSEAVHAVARNTISAVKGKKRISPDRSDGPPWRMKDG